MVDSPGIAATEKTVGISSSGSGIESRDAAVASDLDASATDQTTNKGYTNAMSISISIANEQYGVAIPYHTTPYHTIPYHIIKFLYYD